MPTTDQLDTAVRRLLPQVSFEQAKEGHEALTELRRRSYALEHLAGVLLDGPIGKRISDLEAALASVRKEHGDKLAVALSTAQAAERVAANAHAELKMQRDVNESAFLSVTERLGVVEDRTRPKPHAHRTPKGVK
jgi:hypothetical protein